MDADKAFQVFQHVCAAAASSGRLGIFRMECAHRFNQSLQASSSSLGRAKDVTKMAAEAFLNSVMVQHRRQVGSVGGQYFDW